MNMKYAILIFCLSMSATLVHGQNDTTTADITLLDLTGRADFLVPQSPAFTILGVTPDNVISPTSYRSLALSFLDGVDQEGNVQSGFAVDTKPYFLAKGESISLKDYRGNVITRQLSRMQLSFATSSSDSSSMNADRYGISLRLTLWDMADPRLDTNLEECRPCVSTCS